MRPFKVAGLSDQGLVRQNNEDRYFFKYYRNMLVAAVADGMGGAACGEIASSIAVETIESLFDQNYARLGIEEMIEDCQILAHNRIRQQGRTEYGNINMGTTISMVAVFPEKKSFFKGSGGCRVYSGHVGDSRIYHICHGNISQISHDHSVYQRLIESGVMEARDPEIRAYKNMIYLSLGGSEEFDLQKAELFYAPRGSALLLCSDGLSNHVSEEEMVEIIYGAAGMRDAAKYLIELAKERGGNDNITAVIVACPGFKNQRNSRGIRKKFSRLKIGNEEFSGKIPFAVSVVLVSMILLLLIILWHVNGGGYFF